ncbi:MAG: hypothetical protein HN580_16855 [Deltaproteobacteria bacterium]|jgi:hypothetical protein|nr:hypothetical protein [Deltaproteobacteria bacterium]MBT4091964.1 hypothetical protein [Deltaproteobacteria bacterium]MBT4263735.1 hypothetical protein [Deltaproteobacteria bacterium]MBT4637401.1 hypothetical protein [Deltaproteobacteria bacterium]MBT6499238.1 hypothetical protein [Deltaproteobacteria bacterium]
MIKHPIHVVLKTMKIYLDRSIVVLISLFFLSYSIISSASCRSFENLNKIFNNAYTELLVLEDDSGEMVVLLDSFCEVDTGSEDSSEENDDPDCEQCTYCQATNNGLVLTQAPPLNLNQAIASSQKIHNHGRSYINKKITLNHPQRAPPQV